MLLTLGEFHHFFIESQLLSISVFHVNRRPVIVLMKHVLLMTQVNLKKVNVLEGPEVAGNDLSEIRWRAAARLRLLSIWRV